MLDPIHKSLNGKNHWQFGTGRNSTLSWKMFGCTVVDAEYFSGHYVDIRHMVVEGLSHWIIGLMSRERLTFHMLVETLCNFLMVVWKTIYASL